MKNILLLVIITMAMQNSSAQNFQRIEDLAKIDHVQKTNGVAVADYDQDGDLDIFFTGIEQFSYADETTWNHLLRNKGDGTFEDVTIAAGFEFQYINYGIPAARGEKMGASWGDYDNDGYPDLFLANSREDQLYHNEGNGTFIDVTYSAGVYGCIECYSSSGLWWDHDNDGDLDLFVNVLNNYNFMYDNKGDGTFEDITQEIGFGGDIGNITWSSVAIKTSKDGFLDLYNINDVQENKLFVSHDGIWYEEATSVYGLADKDGAGMGVTVGDYNNDGLFDIYVTNIFHHHPNPLYTHLPAHDYRDDARAMGVDNSGWGWGTHFFDCDHDGDEDLAAVNGPIDKLDGLEQPDIDNFFFKNMLKEGTAKFVDGTLESGFGGVAKGKGLEVFDYDGDGDLDIVVANMEEAAYLFRNETIEDMQPELVNWLQIKLEGTASNRDGFGTDIKLTIGEDSYYRYHHGAAIFGGSIKPVHFGVAEATVIDKIQFTWLSGLKEAIYNVPVNQILHFKEGSGTEIVVEDEPEYVAIVEKNYNFPNPFNNSTTIHFDLAKVGTLDLKLYSTTGEEIFHTTQTVEVPGALEILWDSSDLPSGVYLYTADIKDRHYEGRIIKLTHN